MAGRQRGRKLFTQRGLTMSIAAASHRPAACWDGPSSLMCIPNRASFRRPGPAPSRCGGLILRAILTVVVAFGMFPSAAAAQGATVDGALLARAKRSGWSRVIVTLKPGAALGSEISKLGGRSGRKLQLINGMVAELPN